MVHSVSDAMNKIVSMNGSNVQFSDILTRWMTEQGIITVTLPDQTTQQLRTTKEMDKQLDGKFDKAGGSLTGYVAAQKEVSSNFDGALLSLITSDKVRGPHIAARREASGAVTRHNMPDAGGTLMQVGDYGWGGNADGQWRDTQENISIKFKLRRTESQIWRNNVTTEYGRAYAANAYFKCGDSWMNLSVSHDKGVLTCAAGNSMTEVLTTIYGTSNTTKDSNGNLKAASPIVKVFADDIDVNDESEGVTLKKLHTGIYQLCGVLGMHSDASWGGINGGITIPSGINQLPLVYVDYDVLVAGERHPFNGEVVQQEEHGDIVIYISYRKHLDLPQNVQYARLKAYPEFSREIDGKLVELEAGDFIDVPTGHWIDVRVNMPSDSLYNQKQAEAQRLAEIEAERLAKEEAECAAEEAEKAEE